MFAFCRTEAVASKFSGLAVPQRCTRRIGGGGLEAHVWPLDAFKAALADPSFGGKLARAVLPSLNQSFVCICVFFVHTAHRVRSFDSLS